MRMIFVFLVLLLSLPALAQDQGESALLLVSGGGSSGIVSYVQGVVGTGTPSGASSASFTVTSGDLVFAIMKIGNTNVGVASVTPGSTGVTCTWTKSAAVDADVNGSSTIQAAWCIPSSSGLMSVTAVWSGENNSTDFADIAVMQLHSTTGFAATPLDVSAIGTPVNSSICSSGSATTTNSHDAIVGVCENWNAAQSYPTVSGYTYESTSSRNTAGLYFAATTTTGSQSFTINGLTTDSATGLLFAFKTN